MSNIKSLKVGDRVRIKNSCTRYDKLCNGEVGTVTLCFIPEYPDEIPLDIGRYNPRATSGCFYFRENDLEIISEANTTPEVVTTFEEDWWNEDESCLNTINNKGEGKMRSEKIINLWRDKQSEAISNVMKKEKKEILNLDPIYSNVKKHIAEIDKILMKDGVNTTGIEAAINDALSSKKYTLNATDVLLSQTELKKNELLSELFKQCDEICAMLTACETYEQEMEVLKTYNVIGENGKLVIVNE